MSFFIPEIVAPAGNMEKLQTSCRYGADAVYLGLKNHNLRIASENFNYYELVQALEFARKYGVRIYVLLNSMPDDYGLKNLEKDLEIFEGLKPDAVIVSDAGVLDLIRKKISVPIHLSTQSSCCNTESALFWKDSGISRIILGREVSIQHASVIKEKTGIEVEMFIHGAMCTCWSGNCTLSNYMTGRDANRGGCCQACRFRYDIFSVNDFFSSENAVLKTGGTSFMSSKDLNGISRTDDFIKYGIDAVKIEGRMKSPLYAATLVKAYREAFANHGKTCGLNNVHAETDRIKHRKYTEGFLKNPLNPDTISVESAEPSAECSYAGTVIDFIQDGKKIVLHIKNPFTANDYIEALTFSGRNISVNSKSMTDIKGKPVHATRPNTVVLMENIKGIEKYNILRKRNEINNRN